MVLAMPSSVFGESSARTPERLIYLGSYLYNYPVPTFITAFQRRH